MKRIIFTVEDNDALYVTRHMGLYKQLWREMRQEPHNHTPRYRELHDEQVQIAEDIVDFLSSGTMVVEETQP